MSAETAVLEHSTAGHATCWSKLLGVSGIVSGPGDRCHGRSVHRAGHPRGVGLQERGAGVQGPPPATAASGVVPAAPPVAAAAAEPLTGDRPEVDDDPV